MLQSFSDAWEEKETIQIGLKLQEYLIRRGDDPTDIYDIFKAFDQAGHAIHCTCRQQPRSRPRNCSGQELLGPGSRDAQCGGGAALVPSRSSIPCDSRVTVV